MNDEQLQARIADLLHYPLAGRLPDVAVDALCVWWLRKLGVLHEKAAP